MNRLQIALSIVISDASLTIISCLSVSFLLMPKLSRILQSPLIMHSFHCLSTLLLIFLLICLLSMAHCDNHFLGYTINSFTPLFLCFTFHIKLCPVEIQIFTYSVTGSAKATEYLPTVASVTELMTTPFQGHTGLPSEAEPLPGPCTHSLTSMMTLCFFFPF